MKKIMSVDKLTQRICFLNRDDVDGFTVFFFKEQNSIKTYEQRSCFWKLQASKHNQLSLACHQQPHIFLTSFV